MELIAILKERSPSGCKLNSSEYRSHSLFSVPSSLTADDGGKASRSILDAGLKVSFILLSAH